MKNGFLLNPVLSGEPGEWFIYMVSNSEGQTYFFDSEARRTWAAKHGSCVLHRVPVVVSGAAE